MTAPEFPPAASDSPSTAAGGAPRSWTLTVPPGLKLITLNDRLHHMAKHRYTKALREAGWALAKQQRIPALARVRIDGVLIPADRRDRDAHNWMLSAKALVDGVVDAGVIPGDATPYLLGPFLTVADEPSKPQRLVLTITELPALEARRG